MMERDGRLMTYRSSKLTCVTSATARGSNTTVLHHPRPIFPADDRERFAFCGLLNLRVDSGQGREADMGGSQGR